MLHERADCLVETLFGEGRTHFWSVVVSVGERQEEGKTADVWLACESTSLDIRSRSSVG